MGHLKKREEKSSRKWSKLANYLFDLVFDYFRSPLGVLRCLTDQGDHVPLSPANHHSAPKGPLAGGPPQLGQGPGLGVKWTLGRGALRALRPSRPTPWIGEPTPAPRASRGVEVQVGAQHPAEGEDSAMSCRAPPQLRRTPTSYLPAPLPNLRPSALPPVGDRPLSPPQRARRASSRPPYLSILGAAVQEQGHPPHRAVPAGS